MYKNTEFSRFRYNHFKDTVIYPTAGYITRFSKSLFFKVEDYVKRNFPTIGNHKSQWKKLLVILGIVTCFTMIGYLRSGPKTDTVKPPPIIPKKPRTPPICGFYHFATVSSPWRGIVHEQILVAYLSGLINASSSIYVTGLGKSNENKTIYDIFDNPKFIYEYDIITSVYEFPTLKKVEKYCLENNDSLIWYAHSKGASHGSDDSAAWRGLMNHFVLKKWRLCHGLLASTNYTTCGSILTFDSQRKAGWNTYYAGNMWWSKCSQINRLTRIEKLDQNDRYIAELYVTSEPDVGHFNCYSVNPHEPWMFNTDNNNCSENQPLWKVR